MAIHNFRTDAQQDELDRNKRLAQFVSSGTIDKQDDSNVFNAVVGNEYKFQDNSDYANLDGNIFNFPTGTEIDMTGMLPEVIVQSQATNGLVVQSSVNAGDYVVVDKEELVTNGTFDTDTDWNKQTGWTISGGVATCNGTNSLIFQETLHGYKDGDDLVFKYDITAYTSGSVALRHEDTYGTQRAAIGSYTEKITLTGIDGIGDAVLLGIDSVNFIGSIDNISVQLKEDIYRATEDIPSLTSLTDARFETRAYISNQVLAYRQSDGTLGYETLFVDATETDTVNDVMIKNGYSKLSNGLYSKGLITVTPMYLVQT